MLPDDIHSQTRTICNISLSSLSCWPLITILAVSVRELQIFDNPLPRCRLPFGTAFISLLRFCDNWIVAERGDGGIWISCHALRSVLPTHPAISRLGAARELTLSCSFRIPSQIA